MDRCVYKKRLHGYIAGKHKVLSTKEHNTNDILRDFKKYTSKQLIKAIQEYPAERGREWMLDILKNAGEKYSRNTGLQFW